MSLMGLRPSKWCGRSSPSSSCSIICCPTWMAWSAWTGSERARGWDRHQSFSWVPHFPKEVRARADLIFLEKPCEMDTLLDLIRHVLEESSREPLFPPSNLQAVDGRSQMGSGFSTERVSQCSTFGANANYPKGLPFPTKRFATELLCCVNSIQDLDTMPV